ncbi:hypothetical protein JW960_16105 [candidate division KSB1 bacterium]|nr:hypothetical protein [candidate division KSB1 bacterium]
MNTAEKINHTVTRIISDHLALHQRVAAVVTGNNMAPLFHKGDQIVAEAAPVTDIVPGDIIMYQHRGTHCTHRFVTRISESVEIRIATKGDGWRHFDVPIHPDKLVGRVCMIHTKTGQMNLQAKRATRIQHLLGKLLRIEWQLIQQRPSCVAKIIVHLFHPINVICSHTERLIISIFQYNKINTAKTVIQESTP